MHEVKLLGGGYYVPATIWSDNGRVFFKTPGPWTSDAAAELVEEIKSLKGRRWHPDKKAWSAPLNYRNQVALKALMKGEEDPFERYFTEPKNIETRFPLWQHQQEAVNFLESRKHAILAAEMGLGKTLVFIALMELHSDLPTWYISNRPGIEAVRYELEKWECKAKPELMTYERLVKRMEGNPDLPNLVVFDESSRIKTPTSQRSSASLKLANELRAKDVSYIFLGTGTPAPKDPTDWWHQCEVACPAFLREGDRNIMRRRLAFLDEQYNSLGQKYWAIKSWKDDEEKCAHCGDIHDGVCGEDKRGRPIVYTPSVNEIKLLHKRLSGLVLMKSKKDCLDLPDKQYFKRVIQADKDTLEAAKYITDLTSRGVEALTLLRELSDGFQYSLEVVGTEDCPCGGGEDVDDTLELEVLDLCPYCAGEGVINQYSRVTKGMNDAKIDEFEKILEEHEDVGRLVCFAAFTGSIDKLEAYALERAWTVFRVDGRGWVGTTPEGTKIPSDKLIYHFQGNDMDRILWLGHPRSSGMGLTLTASPTIVFYSNSFSAEDRIQAEDRCHRPGMDLNKGLRIIDLIHLPTDELVLNNIKEKKRLQNITLGEIKEVL